MTTLGLHVCIYREGVNGERIEHPEWDWIRMAGDRDLPSLMAVQKQVGHPMDFEFWHRPKDPEKMRQQMEQMHPGINHVRWKQLAEILRDPEWWVYFSY